MRNLGCTSGVQSSFIIIRIIYLTVNGLSSVDSGYYART